MTSETDPQEGSSSPAEETKAARATDPSVEDLPRTVSWAPRAPKVAAEFGTPLPVAFGDYLLIERIAGGGMGVVYKARQKKLGRIVALKMILAGHLASEEEVRRFSLEAEAAAQLDHPGIVPIFEVGEHEGRHYFSMGYVEGGSLADRVKEEGPLPAPEAADLVRQVAEAVAYAHQQGVIHRDLKPGNVLLDKGRHAKVTDFGLAKRVQGTSHLTVYGQVLGTPSYMPPEQAAGKIEQVGPAADIYSTGAILYCLLTGRPPFQSAQPVDTLRQVLEQEPASPRQLNGAVGRDLDTICLKCLQKDPSKRYGSATDLAEDLRRFLTGEPIQARPVGRAERFARWCRRNPLVAALAAGVILSLLFGMGFVLYFAAQARTEAALAKKNEQQAVAEKALSERRLYDAEINLAYQAWRDSRITVAQDLLQHHVPSDATDPDYRDFEWYYLQRLCQLLDLHTLKGHSGAVWNVAYSADGRRLASCGSDGTVRIWNAVTWDVLLTLRGHAAPVPIVAFSPTGLTVASGDDQGFIKIWDTATGKLITSWKAHEKPIRDLAFSPDGRQIASASYDKTVRLWQATTGTSLCTLSGHSEAVLCVAYARDGRSLASGGGDSCVRLWDLGSGKEKRTLRHTSNVVSVAYSADGRQLASATRDSIRVWNAMSGEPTRSFGGHSGDFRRIVFSPDSRNLASCSEDQTVRVWNLESGLETLTLRHAASVWGLAFRPDGCFLASAGEDGTVRVWDATTEVEPLLLPSHQHPISSVACRPDGQQFASAELDQAQKQIAAGEVKVWNLNNGHVMPTPTLSESPVTCLAYSVDSRWLAGAVNLSGTRGKPQPGRIKIWDATTGAERGTLLGHTGSIWCLAFGPDGRLASASDDGTIRIWDVATMNSTQILSESAMTVDFSKDGRLTWVRYDGTVKILDADGGESLILAAQSAGTQAAAFNPCSNELALATLDSIGIWDTTTGQRKLVLKGREGAVFQLAYTPNGERLVAAGLEGLRIWDARTGIELVTLPASLSRLTVGPDGRQLIAGGYVSGIRIWDSSPLTPAMREEYEARGVVHFRLAAATSQAHALRLIREDPLLRETVRARALVLAEYGSSH
jgi:WD40 repeat protein/tRNA A-37 threonylcarbamoyl transferase component Bud32